MLKKIEPTYFANYLFAFLISLIGEVSAQNLDSDNIFKYQYSVIDTPYGDYFGWIILERKGQSYAGKIIDEEGSINTLKVTKFDDKRLFFKSRIDGLKSVFKCEIFGDSIRGVGIFPGEEFKFILKGKRVREQAN
jgi:hypothetical protein